MTKLNPWQFLSTMREVSGLQNAAHILAFSGASRLNLENSLSPPIGLEAASEHAGGKALDEATRALLDLSPTERLSAIDELIASSHGRHDPWLLETPAKRFAEFVDSASSVRCSFEASLHTALLLAIRGKEVLFLSQNRDICGFAQSLAVLLECKLQVQFADPLARTDTTKFEAEVAFPPFGSKPMNTSQIPRRTLAILDAEEGKKRLTEDVLALADALAQSTGQTILCVPDGLMYRGVGVEPLAREALVASGRLKGVLAVPGGMIFPNTMMDTDVLVLTSSNMDGSKVRMLDLSHPSFSGRTVRGRPEILPGTNWARYLEESTATDETFAKDVSLEEIKEKDFILSINRYLLPPAAVALEGFLERSRTIELQDAVELIRPLSLGKAEDGEFTIFEASPADVSQHGLLTQPHKISTLERAQMRKARNQRLLPGDVILSVKGTIGTAGLVPADAPTSDEDGFWTAGQSFMILRPKRGGVSGVVLYEYLASPTVVEALRTLAGGSGIQSIAIKDLKAFRVPIPSEKEAERAELTFKRRQERHAQIETILAEIEAERTSSWPSRELNRDMP
ncbi:N-6 DNA methylase [uncultured Shimia sp.]|uniref:N-6 DNA methylase n=1 Tax=uncultured Shimia sp. TaxID=573152 RepID=UPI00260696A5|nr:N-6 DNA methylase [uncultured Shimia sp.]